MAESSAGEAAPPPPEEVPTADGAAAGSRREKRMALKKMKRKQARKESAIREREEADVRANDPEERLRAEMTAREEAEAAERARRAFEESERRWLEVAAARKKAAEEEEERRRKLVEDEQRYKTENVNESEEGDDWEYVEDGPAEIIWRGNEIIVKKKRVRVSKIGAGPLTSKEDDDRPTSNPLPPQSAAFASYKNTPPTSAQEVLETAAQQIPNFGTEQDKTHCPFHLKTGACRFGSRCSRVHFRPDKSCTLLIKNMYSGPGLAWEQDEGLENCHLKVEYIEGSKFWPQLGMETRVSLPSYTDEEVERYYEEFYEDVHTEFLKFGELVNFKACRNGSYHLRGNVYVHYKFLESAILAYNTMNGRYFAGKQIICEFIGVTRWKVAICGEFMKSRLKTCSRGTACNFIHCFRNPGGDYEWADWDNPPPKHWIKKMASLFGPSRESDYGKDVELEDWDKPIDTGRKNTPTNNRHLSRTPYNERGGWNTDSDREDADTKRERRSVSGEHYSKMRELDVLKRRWSEERHKSVVHDYHVKSSHGLDSDEDYSRKKDRELDKKRKKYDEHNSLRDHERHKSKHRTREDRNSKVAYNDEGKISEKKYKSKFHKRYDKAHSSDRHSECSDDNRNTSDDRSSGKRYEICVIDSHERYDGRILSDDLGCDSDTYAEKASMGSSYLDDRKESDRYDSRCKRKHMYHDPEGDHKKGKIRKSDASNNEFVDGESTDHQEKKQRHSSQERSQDCSSEYRSGQSINKVDIDEAAIFMEDTEKNRDKEHRKHSRNNRKGKHSLEKRKYEEIEEDISCSDSSKLELNKKAKRMHSRSRSPVRTSGNRREERTHSRSHDS